MDIAIKYEKINLGENKFVFKPISVIMGEFDKDANIFVTEYGELCEPIDGGSPYEDSYFGNVTSIEKLKEVYNLEIENDALMEYYDSFSLYYTLGYYDHGEGKIQILNVHCSKLEEALESEMEEQDDYEQIEESDEVTINLSVEE